MVGAHKRDRVRETLWPWLKSRGYVTDEDDPVLAEWLSSCLGRRDAFLRPGLRLKRTLDAPTAVIREEINTILAAAGEPGLPRSDAR